MCEARTGTWAVQVEAARELLNTVPANADALGEGSGASTEGAALADNGDDL